MKLPIAFKKFVRRFPISKIIVATVILMLAATTVSNAQTLVTFKVNLKPQLKDSIYVPGRDRIYLQGNKFPLSNNKKIYLKDTSTPADSVFEATVNFPSSANDEKLKYNYYIFTPDKLLTEQMVRSLRLRKGERELDALYFNTFAW